ncbi:MAG: Glycyl-glycine endopeptidase precursor [Rickettsiaceae bacterium]|jgi:murein DD-endopeptidase MepM/ murein hydrolase activator NlpD|nr:Glycyl-glycine endopeptidase precursor [Rickettsiaceae bacterium]
MLGRLVDLVELIIEHRLFKPISVSIITSFVLFSSFSYLQNYLGSYDPSHPDSNSKHRIKINIKKGYNGFNLNDNQTVVHQIQVGDTLLKILFALGASDADVFSILSEMRKIYDPKLINVGDKFLIKYQVDVSYKEGTNQDEKEAHAANMKDVNRKVYITKIIFNPSPEREVTITGTKNTGGGYSYKATEVIKKLTKQIVKYNVTIKNGLYVDGVDVGISPNIMVNMINLYSFDVDFQRDIREGDKFEILFESYYDDKGNRIKNGEVLFASLNLQRKKTIDFYLHKISGKSEYFDSKGNSVKKSLLKTPINGARISSRFGMRRHPVLGYSKMHKGIDFAAPTGTPIFAAGNGTITYYGRKGGYGNFVQIRHTADYSTGYGHASRFVKSLHVGSKVRQGEVVAYVGTTGRSTGPHLHYEIMIRGKQVNPSSVKSASGLRLGGNELKKFMSSKAEIDKYLKTIPNQNKL